MSARTKKDLNPFTTRFSGSSQIVKVGKRRPGTNALCQLLTDTLNLEGRPRKRRGDRYLKKWGELKLQYLRTEIIRLYQAGLGLQRAPVYRNQGNGDVTESSSDNNWVLLLSPGVSVPKKTKAVYRDRANKKDRDDNTLFNLNRHGVLMRNLNQGVFKHLSRDRSEAAELVIKLLKRIEISSEVNCRWFPRDEDIECGSEFSLMLLEAVFLLLSDRYLEKCFVSDYSPEVLKQCGIRSCAAPYFVSQGRIRGCAAHRGKKFRDSTAYKRLSRSGPPAEKEQQGIPIVPSEPDKYGTPHLKRIEIPIKKIMSPWMPFE